MTIRSSSALAALFLAACADPQESALVDGVPDVAHPSNAIYNGYAPDSWEHDAVVSLHQVVGGTTYVSPFCTGTLITSDVVLTAGHCVEDFGGVMSPSEVKIYVGDDPSFDFNAHDYTVSEVSQHPTYNGATLVGDIALIRLSTPVTEAVTPVAALPVAQGFTAADAGMIVNFAGFGYDETGGFGVKQQVDLPLGGLGCGGVSGCSGASTTYQVAYAQTGGIGPCSGDSGGPLFVYRGGSTYVGGVTSYGDAACTRYGVSTRADAYESYIADFIAADPGGGGGGSTVDCSAYEEEYTGTLSSSGDYDVHPGGTYYYAASGTHVGYLEGPSGTDFDLYLYKYSSGTWRVNARSEGGTSIESISKSNRTGYYLWNVSSYSGSGAYTLCADQP